MKCHYEVLNVSRTADENEIRSAYKKSALTWHPDKNLDNVDHAKEQFQLVQQAYEVLSDKQERAWYDKHREQILAKSNGSAHENTLDVYQYFTSACYEGHSDEDNGFYGVYRHVFEQIAKEDLEFMDNKDEFLSIPTFGFSYSNYEDVVGPFYSYWLNYCTKKSYAWLDPYDIENTRERRLFKIIEKENKKVRQKAKKERNEEVRALVAFVKKRDKRMQLYLKQLEAKNIENRQKQEQLSKQKRLERKKELNSVKVEAEWSKFDNVKNELEEIEKSLNAEFGNESEDEDDNDNLYCVACNKIFKTPKAFVNHESSKKHKENVQKLKVTMAEEEEDLEEEDSNASEDDDDLSHVDNENGLEASDISQEEVAEVTPKVKEKKKKGRVLQKTNPSESAEEIIKVGHISTDDESPFDFNSSKKSKRKSKKAPGKQTNNNNEIANKSKANTIETVDAQCTEKKDDVKVQGNSSNLPSTEHTCVTCKSSFPSKNRLFAHLKKTGHSVYLPHQQQQVKTSAKKTVKTK